MQPVGLFSLVTARFALLHRRRKKVPPHHPFRHYQILLQFRNVSSVIAQIVFCFLIMSYVVPGRSRWMRRRRTLVELLGRIEGGSEYCFSRTALLITSNTTAKMCRFSPGKSPQLK
jgi:hypothetical protein